MYTTILIQEGALTINKEWEVINNSLGTPFICKEQ